MPTNKPKVTHAPEEEDLDSEEEEEEGEYEDEGDYYDYREDYRWQTFNKLLDSHKKMIKILTTLLNEENEE